MSVEVCIHPFLISILLVDGCSASCPCEFILGEIAPDISEKENGWKSGKKSFDFHKIVEFYSLVTEIIFLHKKTRKHLNSYH
jgi:hypothetical protein